MPQYRQQCLVVRIAACDGNMAETNSHFGGAISVQPYDGEPLRSQGLMVGEV